MIDIPEHPLHQLPTLLDDGPDWIGARLVGRFIERWDQCDTFEPLLTVWRSAADKSVLSLNPWMGDFVWSLTWLP